MTKKNYPLVSIIIVNYNQKALLIKCLNSLKRISYPDYEVIVVDNGSTESCKNLEKYNRVFKRFSLIENEKNLGFSGGNNKGYEIAKGKYILLLNNDTKATRGFLEPLVEDLEKDPKLGIVQSKMLVMDKSDLLDSVVSYQTSTGFLYHRGYLEKDSKKYEKFRYGFSVKGACMLIRKKALNLGLFDDTYFAYFEETDLCWRTWLLGYKVGFEPQSVIYHKMGATSLRMDSWFIQFHSFKNRICTIIKNTSLPTMVWMLPLNITVSLGFCCFLFLTGKSVGAKSVLEAIFWNVSNITDTLNYRSKVQSLRKFSDKQVFADTFKNPIAYERNEMTGREEACIRLAKSIKVSGKKVLDIGCSVGWFPKIATEELGVKKLVAIEPDSEKFKKARKNAPKAMIQKGVAGKLDFAKSSFDVVSMFDVIEHVPPRTEPKVFAEINKVLKKGGYLLISTPYASLVSKLTDPAWYFGHRHYSEERMTNILNKTGFEVLSVAVHGGFWEIVGMAVLYITKWIFKIPMPFEEWFDVRRRKEFVRPGKIIMFIVAQKA
jgi:GT2 family glycosyltransferase/protein-L-isoaspartate O-methyltransferase